jgi:anaerobic magnesium-protoporphyrin IX monomethyl ester cyclase
MSKLLFAHSYVYRFDDKQWKNKQPYPPYGTIYAAAVMREVGHEVSLFDANLIADTSELAPVLDLVAPEYLVIYDDGFNYLTKMCLTAMRDVAHAFVQMGRERGCTVIVSSSDSTDHYADYLAAGADFVLLGEAELTLKELIENLGAGETRFGHVLGLAFKTPEGEIVRTPGRPVIKELDTLPDPAWDLVDIESYRRIWIRHHGYFSLNIATTRGCPYKCNWCAKPIYGNRYNSRSPERVAAELEMLTKSYGASHLWVCDDIFGLKPGWVQSFRDEVRTRGLRFGYKIQSRVDLLLQEDNIDALAASGLEEVWVGAESGSQKILDAMDKGTQVEEIEQATRLLQRKGIRVAFFLQFGYLGETDEDIRKTLQMVYRLMPDDIGVSVSYPLPGTKFYEKVREQLSNKQNWRDSDDLDMMFAGTYPPAFYKRLHRLVHKGFRKRQALAEVRKLMKGSRAQWRKALSLCYYAPAEWLEERKLRSWARLSEEAR